MKKLFTLIIGLTSISAVFAQSGRDRNHGYNSNSESGYNAPYTQQNNWNGRNAQNSTNYERGNESYGHMYGQGDQYPENDRRYGRSDNYERRDRFGSYEDEDRGFYGRGRREEMRHRFRRHIERWDY